MKELIQVEDMSAVHSQWETKLIVQIQRSWSQGKVVKCLRCGTTEVAGSDKYVMLRGLAVFSSLGCFYFYFS